MRSTELGIILALALPVAGAADTELLKASTVKITVEHDEGTSTGSGIILCQQDGRLDILTAKHVLTGQGLVDASGERSPRFRGVEAFRVAFYRNSPLPIHAPVGAAVVQKAEFKDLALLTVDGIDASLTRVTLGESTPLRSGVEVESVGHLDVDWDWTRGTVRSVGEFIRHSSDIDRGHSGGPLFNAAGELVGLNLQEYRDVARAMPIEEAMLTVRRWIDPRCVGEAESEESPATDNPLSRRLRAPGISAFASDSPPPSRPAAGHRDVTRVEGVEFALRFIPAGSFQMGSPESEEGRDGDEPQHRVTLTRSFWMGETEITQAQWQALMGTEPSRFKECGSECPVERVNWYAAVTFANELSKRSRLTACYQLSGDNGRRAGEGLVYQDVSFEGLECPGYRLPTEAEWEYAARASTTKPFWTGENLTTEQANYNGNLPYAGHAKGEYRQTTVEVRSFDANPWGLHGVHGNVREWTQDAAEFEAILVTLLTPTTGTDKAGRRDPLSTRGPLRVLRGGGWGSGARYCRAANRDAVGPGNRSDFVGFRLVRTLP